jgi:hypothetical protein
MSPDLFLPAVIAAAALGLILIGTALARRSSTLLILGGFLAVGAAAFAWTARVLA